MSGNHASLVIANREFRMPVFALVFILVSLSSCAQLAPNSEVYPTKGARNTTVYVESKTGKEVVVYDLTGDWDANYPYGPEIVRIAQRGNYFEGIKTIGNASFPKGYKTVQGKIDGSVIHCATMATNGYKASTGKTSNAGDRFECTGVNAGSDYVIQFNRRR